MSSRKQRLIALDLFAGCGGTTLGLKMAGFDVLAAVEKNYAAAQVYAQNHPGVLLKEVDITTLSPNALRKELGLRRGELHLLAGCPPCQGFSSLRTFNGAKSVTDPRNGLIAEMSRYAQAFLPKVIMMENVPGLARQPIFDELCTSLQSLGYKVKFDVKDASKYGVPQRRKRLLLLASRAGEICFGLEKPSKRTVWKTIGFLQEPGKGKDKLHNLPEVRSHRIQELISLIPKDGGSRSALPKSKQLKCHQGKSGFNDIYGRMAWDEVAPTITGGCFNPSKGRFLHPTQNRTITMREAALLQTFPKGYRFDVSLGKQKIALMIGNALPPEFIRQHAVEVARLFAP